MPSPFDTEIAEKVAPQFEDHFADTATIEYVSRGGTSIRGLKAVLGRIEFREGDDLTGGRKRIKQRNVTVHNDSDSTWKAIPRKAQLEGHFVIAGERWEIDEVDSVTGTFTRCVVQLHGKIERTRRGYRKGS